jgi:mannosyltransferase OCH1-like enzyme
MSCKSNHIPKNFHQIWIGGKLPPAQKAIINWNKQILGKTWKCKLWGNKDLTKKNFPITWSYIQKSKRYWGKKPKYAQISDLMRYELLYWYGGIYADASLQLSKSLDPMIDEANNKLKQLIVCDQNTAKLRKEEGCPELGCLDRGKKYVSNSFIGSRPKSDAMTKAMSKKLLDKIDVKDNHIAYQTGPTYLRSTFRKGPKIMIIKSDLIYPYNWYVPGSLEEDEDMQLWGKEGKDPDKCITKTKSKTGKFVQFLDQRKRLRYLQIDCTAYKSLWGRKIWSLGSGWHKA